MTNIQDTLTYADGSLPNGQVVVSWPMFQTNGVPVANGQEAYPVVNGQIQLTLYPNVNALPGGTYYTARFELDEGAVYQEYWIVPNLTTVTLAQIRATFPPAPGLLINATQLSSGGALAGQFLGWNGSQWVPMYVTTLNVSPNTIALGVTANPAPNISVIGSPAVLGSALTLNIPDAGATSRGVVNTAAQSFAGAKTFVNAATFDSTATFAPVAGVTNAWGELWFGTLNHFHMGGSLTLATPDGSTASLTADSAILKYADLSAGALSPALPAGAITIPGTEAIRLPTGPGYSHGIGVDGADNVWLGTTSASVHAFAYLRPDFAWVANWIDMSPYQHPITANTEATPSQASMVLYKDATQWAGMGFDTNMRIWFRLGPNASGTYYYFSAGGQSFNSSYYVNNTLVAARQGINLIGGTNVAIAGVDNPANSRVDVTFTVSAVPTSRQIIPGTGLTNTPSGTDLSQDRTWSVVPDTTTQRVEWALSGGVVGVRKQLDFISSPSVIWTLSDNTAANRMEVSASFTGAGLVGSINILVNGALAGTEGGINLIQGSGMTIAGVDNQPQGRVDVTLTAAVASVFGRTGAVVAQVGDYSAFYPSMTGSYPDPFWITSLSWSKITGAPAAGVSSVFGRTGVVTAQAGDYSAFYPLMTGSYVNPAWISSLPWSKITGTPVMVNSLNGLSGIVTLAAGTGITVTPAGQTLTIASTGSLNGLTGAVILAAGTGISLTPTGQTITIASTVVAGGTPGGANTQVQVNVNNTFGAYSNFVYTGSALGIGTASPGVSLDVAGNARIQGGANPTTGAGLELAYASGVAYIQPFDRGASTYQSLSITASQIQVGATSGIILQASGGNVGIGTSSPQRPLDVAGTIRVANGGAIEWAGTSVQIAGTSPGDTLMFRTASIERMRITSSGYVGFGTLSPVNPFVVSNAGAAGLEINPGYSTGVYITSYNRASNAYQSTVWDLGGANIVFTGGGRVGIGTANPLATLQVNSGTNQNMQIGGMGWVLSGAVGINAANDANNATIPLVFYGAPIILQGGNVGIGISNPYGGLQVRETTNLDVLFYPNSGLCSIQAVNDAASALIPLQYLASGHYFMGGGNVGIGQTNPGYTLTVNGTAVIGPGYAGTAGDLGVARVSSPTTGVVYFSNSAGTVYLYYDGNNFNFNGGQLLVPTRIGIGTTGTFANLDCVGPSHPCTDAYNAGTGDFRVSTSTSINASAIYMGVDSSSNIPWIQACQPGVSLDWLSINPSGGIVSICRNGGDGTGCNLAVSGGISNNAAVVSAPSDIRLKRDIEPYRASLVEVRQVQPIRFAYNDKSNMEGTRWVSIDAGAHRDIIPDAITSYEGELDGKTTELYNFSLQPLVMAMLNAIKELAARLEKLEGGE